MHQEDKIRYIGDLARVDVKPGDAYVLSVDEHIDEDIAEKLSHMLKDLLGTGAKVLVLGRGMKLGVVSTLPGAEVKAVVDETQDRNAKDGAVASAPMSLALRYQMNNGGGGSRH